MNKKQLDSLSSSLSKAINPAARKIEATGRILERVEPLPVLSNLTQELQIQYQFEGTMLKPMPTAVFIGLTVDAACGKHPSQNDYRGQNGGLTVATGYGRQNG